MKVPRFEKKHDFGIKIIRIEKIPNLKLKILIQLQNIFLMIKKNHSLSVKTGWPTRINKFGFFTSHFQIQNSSSSCWTSSTVCASNLFCEFSFSVFEKSCSSGEIRLATLGLYDVPYWVYFTLRYLVKGWNINLILYSTLNRKHKLRSAQV